MITAKTFISFLDDMDQASTKQFQKILEDKRLTQLEKNILRSQQWLGQGKFEEIFEAIGSTGPSPDPIIESQRLLLLGCAYNNSGEIEHAINLLEQSLDLLNEFKGPQRQKFMVKIALFNVFLNHKDLLSLKKVFQLITPYPEMRKKEEITLQISSFTYYSFIEDYAKANHHLFKLQKLENKMNAYQRVSFFLQKFNFYFKNNDFKECYLVLDEMKVLKKFNQGTNTRFMKALLDKISKGSPIYLYERDFEGSMLLLLQVRCLKALEEQNSQLATKAWNDLRIKYPNLYGENFEFKGDKCLFSECLKLLLTNQIHIDTINLNDLKFDKNLTKEENLYQILFNANTPLSHELLFERIYGKNFETLEDYHRFHQLIVRVKTKYQVEITVPRKGYYFIIKKKAA